MPVCCTILHTAYTYYVLSHSCTQNQKIQRRQLKAVEEKINLGIIPRFQNRAAAAEDRPEKRKKAPIDGCPCDRNLTRKLRAADRKVVGAIGFESAFARGYGGTGSTTPRSRTEPACRLSGTNVADFKVGNHRVTISSRALCSTGAQARVWVFRRQKVTFTLTRERPLRFGRSGSGVFGCCKNWMLGAQVQSAHFPTPGLVPARAVGESPVPSRCIAADSDPPIQLTS